LEHSNIRIIDPVGYVDMLKLLKHAKLVLTDSGGLQKEAFWSRTPCVTLRERTEWVETVEAGVNFLVGTDVNRIVQAVKFIEIIMI
jgi:UDP-N-acetylglucosamine 2-epimerase